MPLVGARQTCVQDPVCVTCWELHDQQRELQNTWARSFCADIVFKLRGRCSLPRNLEVFLLHNKNALLLHSPAKCRSDLMPQTILKDWLFLMTFITVRYIYIPLCVCVYMCIYLHVLCECVYRNVLHRNTKLLEVDIPGKSDYFCVCVFVCFTSEVLPL